MAGYEGVISRWISGKSREEICRWRYSIDRGGHPIEILKIRKSGGNPCDFPWMNYGGISRKFRVEI